MDFAAVQKYLLSFDDTQLVQPFGAQSSVFTVGAHPGQFDPTKMFALVDKASPVNLSLRCDSKLGKTLQHRFESVLPGHNLSRDFITVILSGQLDWPAIQDLIRHAYQKTLDASRP